MRKAQHFALGLYKGKCNVDNLRECPINPKIVQVSDDFVKKAHLT